MQTRNTLKTRFQFTTHELSMKILCNDKSQFSRNRNSRASFSGSQIIDISFVKKVSEIFQYTYTERIQYKSKKLKNNTILKTSKSIEELDILKNTVEKKSILYEALNQRIAVSVSCR